MTGTKSLAGAAVLVLAGGVAEAGGELVLYNWPNYYPPELLRTFEADTGIRVTLEVYDSEETMLARLKAGASGHDVVVASGGMVAVMIEEGLAERIDASSMPNFTLVEPPHEAPPFDPARAYSAPYLWGTTGFTYDRAEVEGGVLDASWREVFEPRPELRGRIAMLGDAAEVWNAAAHYLGFPPCTEAPAEAEAILRLQEAQKPHVATYSSDGTIDRLASGEVALHMQWSGAGHRTLQVLPSAVHVHPEEGVTFWADSFVVPAGAANLENARTFIDWMMAPETIAVASNHTGYMSAIEGAEEHMDAALKESMPSNMPAGLWPPCGPPRADPPGAGAEGRHWSRPGSEGSSLRRNLEMSGGCYRLALWATNLGRLRRLDAWLAHVEARARRRAGGRPSRHAGYACERGSAPSRAGSAGREIAWMAWSGGCDLRLRRIAARPHALLPAACLACRLRLSQPRLDDGGGRAAAAQTSSASPLRAGT
jgi:spermidine/putrescine transport system substrate-binding protein